MTKKRFFVPSDIIYKSRYTNENYKTPKVTDVAIVLSKIQNDDYVKIIKHTESRFEFEIVPSDPLFSTWKILC